jgi:glycyl-tRNA synthetase (class II)
MTMLHDNIVGIDSGIFMHPLIWKASGHVDAFNDPMLDNKDSKKRFRADVLIENYLDKVVDKIQKEVDKAVKDLANPLMQICLNQPMVEWWNIKMKLIQLVADSQMLCPPGIWENLVKLSLIWR